MKTIIFDLDHTVICSAHRQSTLPCGSLDLAHWIENNTPAKIMRDSLLPLATQWQLLSKRKSRPALVVCTARVMQSSDYLFLHKHGLKADAVLSRPHGDRTADHLLKERLLRDYAARKSLSWGLFVNNAFMFDDNQNVINHLGGLGLSVHDAVKVNKMLAASL